MALNLFEPEPRAEITARLEKLQPGSPRQWGKMTASQMLAHCSIALEASTGDRAMKRIPVGWLVAPFFRGRMLNEVPFQHDAPTHPDYKVRHEPDFAAEKARLTALVNRFCERGPAGAEGKVHPLLGALAGQDWGRLNYKHLDHHLRQFGA